MRIGQLSKLIGVEVGTLRGLIDRGLISARRPPRGHYRFTNEDVPKIIEKVKEFGLAERQADEKPSLTLS